MFLRTSCWIRRPASRRSRLAAAALLIGLTSGVAVPLPADAQQAAAPSRPSATQDLFTAIFAHDLAAAQAAVGAGADLAVRNDWGLTAIDLAIDKGYYEIAHYLLSVRNFRRQQTGDEQRPGTAPPAAVASPAPPGPLPGPAQASPAPNVQSGPLPRVGQAPTPSSVVAPAPAWPSDQPNPFAAGSVIPGQPDIIGNIQGPGVAPTPRGQAAPEQAPSTQQAPQAQPGRGSAPEVAAPPAPQSARTPEPAPSTIPASPSPAVADVPAAPPPRPAPPPETSRASTSAVPEPAGGTFGGLLNRLKDLLPFASETPDQRSEPVPTAAQHVTAAPSAAPAETIAPVTSPIPVSVGPEDIPTPLAVSLRLSDDANLDRTRAGGDNCISKRGGESLFCIEPVTWPVAVRRAFETNTILYQGSRAIVRYDGNAATSLYAVFNGAAFETVAAWVEGQFGPPTSATTQRLAVPGKAAADNRIRIWRGRDPASGVETALELRSIDNLRNAFPDVEHGVVMLSREGAAAIFPQLSAIDLMMLR